VAAAKFRELFDRCLHRQRTLMLQATGLYHGTRVVACWAAGLLSTCPTGVRGPTGQLRGLAQEKQSWFEAGRTTKYSIRLSVTYILRTHTDTHTHTHSVLRNGPTYVALALWLNSPPCKWSGVESKACIHNQFCYDTCFRMCWSADYKII